MLKFIVAGFGLGGAALIFRKATRSFESVLHLSEELNPPKTNGYLRVPDEIEPARESILSLSRAVAGSAVVRERAGEVNAGR